MALVARSARSDLDVAAKLELHIAHEEQGADARNNAGAEWWRDWGVKAKDNMKVTNFDSFVYPMRAQ